MQDIVNAAIAKLLSQNKQPSVALVKANVSQPVPMPIIIDVLSRYKQNPDEFSFEPIEQKIEAKNDAITQNQLDRIEAKLDQLLDSLVNK